MERTYPPKKLNVAIGAVHSQIAASGNDVYATWEAIGQGGNTDIFFAQGRQPRLAQKPSCQHKL
jgi:hypothetical protein